MQLSKIKYVALSITHNCNLRCRYCYAGEKTCRSMTGADARRAIDFLADNVYEKCIVTFFGGEPLLRFDLMQDIVAYSKEKYGKRFEFRMSTNGTLLNKKRLKFLKENRIFFVLSIDGNREMHDYNRKFKNKKGSYKRLLRWLPDILQANPYSIAVSVLVPQTVQFLSEGVKDLLEKGFKYVLQTLDYSANWGAAHIAMMKKQYSELSRFYYDNLLKGNKIYYSPFDERIKTRAQKPYGRGDLCDLANSQIAIAASGRIYPCVQFIGTDGKSERRNSIGDIHNGFDRDRRLYFVEENYKEKESCKGCALNGRCATFCGCVNWRATGFIDQIPPIICEHERMLMPIVDKMANRLWRKNVPLFKRKFYERTFPISSYIEDCLLKKGAQNAED